MYYARIAQYLHHVAEEAYGYACAAPDEYSRGYAAGVEDLARYLTESDPAISDRLVAILRSAESRLDELSH